MAMKFQVLFWLFALFQLANGVKMDDPLQEKIESDVVEIGPIQEEQFRKEGYCQWKSNVWYKPEESARCDCLKCTCGPEGRWDCQFNFAYCAYYYCGNQQYDPTKEICCCGKVHAKKAQHSCCGYFYYDTRSAHCCNYYSVLPKSAKCPRYRV